MLKVLDPDWPGEPFPDVSQALDEPNGLLAVGGCLSVERLVNAYRHGIFPWFSEDEPILWWSPAPRWVMAPRDIKISRSLGKRIRQGLFQVTHDLAFDQVMQACAEPRSDQSGTWITEEMRSSYSLLHRAGYAHSFECWNDGRLVGGLYGVAVGCCFFGESMFRRETDASKVAFVSACQQLERWGYRLIDCQVHTPHLESLGAKAMAREAFLLQVDCLGKVEPAANAWGQIQ
jgi:leucyl/phenylalanyl-tRNA---protein transferase